MPGIKRSLHKRKSLYDVKEILEKKKNPRSKGMHAKEKKKVKKLRKYRDCEGER